MKNNKIQRLLLLTVVGLLVVVLAATVFVTLKNNRELRKILDASVKSELTSILVAARETIDVDKFDLYNSKEKIDEDIEAYNKTLEDLRSLQKKVGATYLYAFKKIDGKYYFIFDTDPNPYPNDPNRKDTIFDEYKDISQVYLEAFQGKVSVGVMNVVDQWGSFNAGAIPIYKGDKVIGIVGVDIRDHFIRDSEKTATTNIIILIVTLTLVMAVNIYVIHQLVVTPLRQLTDSVSKSNMDGSIIYGTERSDEFGVLAQTIREMIKDIKLRDKLLVAINESIILLLQAQPDEFERVLLSSMGIIAKAVGVDRMYIWKNNTVAGKLYCTQLYEWSEGAEPQHGNEYTVDVPYDENMPGWEDSFLRNQCINNHVRNMSVQEQAQLLPQGIISILVVPVYISNELWGFVGFDECRKERLFTENEESILRTGSMLLASALLRNAVTRKLTSALEKAQEASLAKSNFLSNMSHEIRTPMNAIIGMTSIGKSAPEMDKKDYAFDRIKDASTHLLGVINDILDVSKIESGKFELSPADFKFEKMLMRVVNLYGLSLEEKKQKLTVYVDRAIPQFLIGDNQRLAQVITNLLGNAVKFTPEEGSINLYTHFLGEENGLCEIKIVVEDSGIGISPEQQTKLFEPFQQAEGSMSRKFGGTGLGLAISKSIVEMMGGRLLVESELGKGARFIFTVKMQSSKTEEQGFEHKEIDSKSISVLDLNDDQHKTGDASVDVNGLFKGRHILLAEDMDINREIVIAILEPTCVEIDCAENGSEAVRMFTEDQEKYDLIFMDLQMPEMDGFEATRRIRALDTAKAREIPIIAMTANVFKEDIENCFAAGMNGHIGKPLDFDELLKKLQTYLVKEMLSDTVR